MSISLTAAKALFAIGTLLSGLTGLIVLHVRSLDGPRAVVILSFLQAFGSGVMISVGLLHMLAESAKSLEHYHTYPAAFFLAGVGFALVYFWEDVVLSEIVLSFSKEISHLGLSIHTHGAAPHCTHDHRTHGHRDSLQQEAQGCLALGANAGVAENVLRSGDDAEHNALLVNDGLVGGYSTMDHNNRSPPAPVATVNATKSAAQSGPKMATDDIRSRVFAFALLGAISVHALFAGLSLGVAMSIDDAWPMFVAIVTHKGVESLVLGSAFISSTFQTHVVAWLLVFFSLITPAGIVIGMIITEMSDDMERLSGYLVSLAAGSFLYVGTLVLKEDDHVGECIWPRTHNLKRFIFWCVGFGIMALVALKS